MRRIDALVAPDVQAESPAPGLRVRHVLKDGLHCYMLFNEQAAPLQTQIRLSASGPLALFDVWTGQVAELDRHAALTLAGHEMKVIVVGEDERVVSVP